MAPMARIILAHDWLVGMRGGERVLDRLAVLFGPTDLYVMVGNGRPHTPAIDACRIHTSWLQQIPGSAGAARRWYLPLYPAAVRSLHVRGGADLLFSTSSAFIKSIRSPWDNDRHRRVPHICYCHTPPRYLWDQRRDYGRLGHGGREWTGGILRAGADQARGWRELGLFMSAPFLRRADRASSDGVDLFLANSSHTALRIFAAYGRNAEVIPPPVRTDFFTPDHAICREDFLLVAGALEPYKRVDLAIEAAVQVNRRLVIAGTGSEDERLKRLAPGQGQIEFLGRVTDEKLRDLFRRAGMLLFPGVEDFGILPVEAISCGCPVIAYQGGGAADWFDESVGVWLRTQRTDALAQGIMSLDARRRDLDSAAMHLHAQRFDEKRFDSAVQAVVHRFV